MEEPTLAPTVVDVYELSTKQKTPVSTF